MSKNIVTLKSGSEVTQGHESVIIRYTCMVSYKCYLVTLSLKRTVFEIFYLLVYRDLENANTARWL